MGERCAIDDTKNISHNMGHITYPFKTQKKTNSFVSLWCQEPKEVGNRLISSSFCKPTLQQVAAGLSLDP